MAMMNGAALRGAPMPQQAAPTGPTGADLQQGMPQQQEPGQDDGGGDELDQMLQTIIKAAQSAGFQLPQGQVPPDQVPKVYSQLLAAAAQSDLGQSPAGAAMIQKVAQALGIAQPQPDQGAPQQGGAPY